MTGDYLTVIMSVFLLELLKSRSRSSDEKSYFDREEQEIVKCLDVHDPFHCLLMEELKHDCCFSTDNPFNVFNNCHKKDRAG